MGETVLVLVWDNRVPWVYECRQQASGYEITCAGVCQEYLARKKRPKPVERIVVAVHPLAMQLVSIDVVGSLSRKHFNRHKRHCLAASLDRKAEAKQCFSVAVAQLPNGAYKHWIAVFDPIRLLIWWERLYQKFGKKPTVVVSVLWLKQHLEKTLGRCYQDVAILQQEAEVIVLLVYRHDQLLGYHRFSIPSSSGALFIKQWNTFLKNEKSDMPDRLLIVQHAGLITNDFIQRISWSGVIETLVTKSKLRHNSFFIQSALEGGSCQPV